MKIRNRRTGLTAEIGVMAMIAAILTGKVKIGKAPGYSRTIRGGKKPPRNQSCPFCTSGIKFKCCCGATPEQKDRRLHAAALHEHGSDYVPYA